MKCYIVDIDVKQTLAELTIEIFWIGRFRDKEKK